MVTEHSENVATQRRNASHMAEALDADNWRSTGLRRNVWKYGFNSWCVKKKQQEHNFYEFDDSQVVLLRTL